MKTDDELLEQSSVGGQLRSLDTLARLDPMDKMIVSLEEEIRTLQSALDTLKRLRDDEARERAEAQGGR